jgi:single-strand DNA-binding protein
VDVVAWGKQAETCGRFLKKGAPVLVEGRLQYDAWQQADGTKRSRLRVRADSVRFLGRPASAGAPAGEKPAVEPAPESGEGEKVPF